MMHVINFLHVFLIWDMLSHACALSGPDSFGNQIQNAHYNEKTKLERQFSLIVAPGIVALMSEFFSESYWNPCYLVMHAYVR